MNLGKMYRGMYWRSLFGNSTSIGARWVAIRSLWIMRNWGEIGAVTTGDN